MKLKYIYRLLLLSVILFTSLFRSIEVEAMHTGFDTEELSEEKKERILSYISLTLLETAPKKRGIRCFDVNEQGMIAVGQECSILRKEVCVYSSQGAFLYGYTFKDYGSISIEWDHENLNIYFARGGDLISLDSDGNVLAVKVVPSTVDNSIYKDSLRSIRRKVGDTTYQIRNDQGFILNVLSFSFSQIVITEPDGTERIIYDVNETERSRKTMNIILIGTFVVHVIAGLIVYIILHVKYYNKLEKLWHGKGWS